MDHRPKCSSVRTAAACVAVPIVLVGTLALAASPSSALSNPSRALVPLGGRSVLAPPEGAVAVGPMQPGALMRLDVTLRVPRPAQLERFIADLSNRSSRLFHHFLRPGQFGSEFGPSPSEVHRVETWLSRAGIHVGSVTRDRLAIAATAPAWRVEAAFHTSIERYRLSSGRTAFANLSAPLLAASVAPFIDGVLGLENLYRLHSVIQHADRSAGRSPIPQRMREVPDTSGPKPCKAVTSAASGQGSYTANQLASYYDMSPLYSLGDLGKRVHVAIAEWEPDYPSDISQYETCYGIKTTVNYVKVDGGSGTGYGSGEAAMDIENVIGLAPDATVDVYQGNASADDTATYDVYQTIVDDDTDQVVSTSWGLCELDSISSFLTSEQPLFEQAATQGQTVVAAAGDSGSTDCDGDGTGHDATLDVDDPGSQPYVVSVGGTSIGTTGESVWNNFTGSGGGGISATWCMPAYQYKPSIPGLVNTDSGTNTSCPTSDASLVRQVPDVSADADPNTGYVIRWDNLWQAGNGGTSASAPLWAAAAALIDASPFCADYGSGDAGVRAQGLYSTASTDSSYIYKQATGHEALYDVTSGNNDYTSSGYTGGLFPATAGFDMASGLGAPALSGLTAAGRASTFFPGLAALMCWTYSTKLTSTHITGVSPHAGPSSKPTTVTITGSGFLPIAGADHVEVGKLSVTATCTSSTRCTAVLPAIKPSTVDLRMFVEDITLSPVVSADRFTFVPAPAVTSLHPASGAAGGGTSVTITGHNLAGVRSVHFGSRAATHVRQVSASEIVATSPSGSGTVYVTVTTAGGASGRAAASRFTYK